MNHDAALIAAVISRVLVSPRIRTSSMVWPSHAEIGSNTTVAALSVGGHHPSSRPDVGNLLHEQVRLTIPALFSATPRALRRLPGGEVLPGTRLHESKASDYTRSGSSPADGHA
jgi:hypothetical protein